jgi:hypothetical protein
MIRLLTPIGLALMTAQAFAQVQVPKSYSDGEVIYADELNTNLKAIADAVPPRDCTTDQIIKWDGSAWVCADMPAGGGGASPELVAAETGSDLTNVIALCPSGKKVTGGGCRFNMVNTAQQLKYCEYIESYPLNDLSGYGCFAEPTPSGSGLCQVTDAYAICQ